MELEALAIPFQSMGETLKECKDNLIKLEKLTRLQAGACVWDDFTSGTTRCVQGKLK